MKKRIDLHIFLFVSTKKFNDKLRQEEAEYKLSAHTHAQLQKA